MPYSKPINSPSLSDLLNLSAKTAVVIGGAGLLGGQMSYVLAELGANVIIASRDLNKCISFAKELAKKYHAINVTALEINITNQLSIQDCLHKVTECCRGGIDILINCGWSGRKNTFESISYEDWNQDIEVCLSGVFKTIKAFVPLLEKTEGNILNVASMYGHVAPDYRLYDSDKFANPPSYGAAKAGVIQLTKYLASFLSSKKIRVNCLSPGPFPFESTQKENPEFIKRLCEKNPLNRIGMPHELKGAVALLCSEAGSYITGQNICVDGGWSVW